MEANDQGTFGTPTSHEVIVYPNSALEWNRASTPG
jgi:hypothetical protein